MSKKTFNVGIMGCGNISPIYFKAGKTFEILNITACASLDMDQTKARAEEFGAKPCTPEELITDPEIDIIVNLTTPDAHADVAMKALNAGKHVHNEKPLAIKREDAKEVLALAKAKNLSVGCAPDTFLGGGIQTCRKLIDEGWIGKPIAANAFMMCHGHEHWHPSPEFYYQVGGGPMFDMGPYYLTALIALMGPVKQVTGSTGITFPERTITSKPKFGKKVKVEVPTHVTGIMNFASGAIGTITTSFDVWAAELPRIEIDGTEGTVSVPDPNTFGGPVRIKRAGAKEWSEIPLTHGYAENSRGIGVADMAHALRSGRKHRANGELAYHVLDIMHAFHEAAKLGRHITLASTCTRPQAFPLGLPEYALD